MKKILSSIMALAVFFSVLGMQVGQAKAEGYITYEGAQYVVGTGIVFTFSAEGFRTRDLKDAVIYVGSDFYDLYCWVRKAEGRILCVAVGGLTEFAGQTGIIYLGGQIFYALIPNKHGIPEEGSSIPVCEQGEVLGAEYMVDFGSGYDGPYFVPGDTLDEADQQADSWFGEWDYYRLGGLVCGIEPS